MSSGSQDISVSCRWRYLKCFSLDREGTKVSKSAEHMYSTHRQEKLPSKSPGRWKFTLEFIINVLSDSRLCKMPHSTTDMVCSTERRRTWIPPPPPPLVAAYSLPITTSDSSLATYSAKVRTTSCMVHLYPVREYSFVSSIRFVFINSW